MPSLAQNSISSMLHCNLHLKMTYLNEDEEIKQDHLLSVLNIHKFVFEREYAPAYLGVFQMSSSSVLLRLLSRSFLYASAAAVGHSLCLFCII